jgi:hypothetical protein
MTSASPTAAKIAPQGGNRMAKQGSEVGSRMHEYRTDGPRKSAQTAKLKLLSKIKDDPTMSLKTKDQKSDRMPYPKMFMILNGLSVIFVKPFRMFQMTRFS